MRTELDTMRLDFTYRSQAENLETAAIGQDGSGPIYKAVQTARRANDVQPGADVEMICISKNDLCPHLAQFSRVNCLHTALCADRHEYGRIHYSMRSG